MDKLKRKSLARLMTYCLARRPDEFGLLPEEGGFVALKRLARALAEEPGWGFLRESHLRETAYGGPFELDDAERIRSTEPGRLEGFFGEVAEPPATLWAAARRRAYPVVRERGLNGAGGRPVVLAASPEAALKIGRRRDAEPVLFEVRAAEAAGEAGVRFTRAGELLYVAEAVPARFLAGPPVEKVAMPRRKPPAPEEPVAVELPGSFFPRLGKPPEEDGPRRDQRRGRNEEPDWKRERRRMRRRHLPEEP